MTLLAYLQKSATPVRRRLTIVLLVSIPVWIYATTWDVLMMEFLNAAFGQGMAVGDVIQMALNRLLVFPLLFAAYFLAVSIPFRRPGVALFLAKQIAIAFLFSVLTRPAGVISEYLTKPGFAVLYHTPGQLFDYSFGYWKVLLYITIQYSIVYLLGLAIILGINAFLRYKSEQLRAEQMRSKWLETRLGTLRGQLHPHFFFNALNLIVSLIGTDPQRARKLVTELGGLLRRSIAESGHEFTTVREEMQFIERYLVIMKARYEERLNIATRLDPQLLDGQIPGFLLMPLVENAIKHGVGKLPGCNLVEITGRRADGMLNFSVRNLTAENGAETIKPHGTGLRNTRRRLSAIYGERFQLTCGPDERGGWISSVAVPLETKRLPAAELL